MPFEGQFDATPGKQHPIDTTVSFSVDNQPIKVDLHDVNRLFGDIDKYNGQFSLGAMMARMLISYFEPEEGGELPPPGNSLAAEHGNQQITAFFLVSAHKKTLHDIGLSMEPVSGGATIMGEGEEASQGQMALNVSSRENFTSFLHALQPAQVETTGLKSYLEKVPAILSQQIVTRYNLMAPEQEALELFGGMEQILEEYKRLGMAEAVVKLEDYYNHGKIGDLREYISIERRGLFSPPGKFFGPADWEIDSSPQYLEARWNEAIAILDVAKQNPKAADLYKRLHEHLSMCVDVALQKLPTLNYIPADTKQEDQTILEVAKQKLEQLAQINFQG